MKKLTHIKPNVTYARIDGKFVPQIILTMATLTEEVRHQGSQITSELKTEQQELVLDVKSLTIITQSLIDMVGKIGRELKEINPEEKALEVEKPQTHN